MCSEAVSSVVGTVLILGITVATFGGISVVILAEVEEQRDVPRVDLHIKTGAADYVVQHRGGDPLPATAITVRIHTAAGVQDHELSAFGVGQEWTIGESIAASEVTAQPPTGLVVIHQNAGGSRILVSEGGL